MRRGAEEDEERGRLMDVADGAPGPGEAEQTPRPEQRPVTPSCDRDIPSTRPEQPLPDLLELDLAELRTVQHPVLRELIEELRERAARPSEVLWGFNNSL
ncbi:FxSxx-COOH cyclophane-containing RiPP peptide [Streptomyces poonensis]|uniref:FXSXX-COOH protein n=1 Tax=Streptomyces poonensis TaxID=68255 RepID=A0A918P7Y5_9ACTN|nr:FxSxx-COOH cyclophane-containing RiPP peptide [Streptomyces poonensis]GGY88965.1 hypothetical protein GCM10010365_03820 [Streptomyces poonensis]